MIISVIPSITEKASTLGDIIEDFLKILQMGDNNEYQDFDNTTESESDNFLIFDGKFMSIDNREK